MVGLRFLLDTNVLSEPLRSIPDARVLELMVRHRGEIATASVAWHELLFGLERLGPSRRRKGIQDYVDSLRESSFPILPYDEAAAAWHAGERARLERRGRPMPFRDGQIGAVAHTRGLTIVTRNVKDFECLRGLRIVDWSV